MHDTRSTRSTQSNRGPAGSVGAPADGETLTDILDRLAAEGHEHEVILAEVDGDPTGTWSGCGHTAALRDAGMVSSHRLEGASDPADMSLVLALACPVCGDTATVVLRYGPEAEPLHAAALAALPDEPSPPHPPAG